MMGRWALGRAATAGIWIAGLALVAPVAAGAGPPNILLLVAEDMGPRVGAFGDAVAVTPRLDALAAEGVRYPNTFTTSGVCAPSRAALMTGVHQIAIGAAHMRTGDRGYRAVPPPDVKAFPEWLRAAGYWTYTDYKLDYQFSGTLAGSGPFTIWDAEGFGTHWRDRPPDQPFFGLVNLGVTHESAVFPRPAWPRSLAHLATQLMYLWQFRDHRDVVTSDQVVLPPYYPDAPALRRDLARHYNNIHRMDEMVGDLLDALAADGLADETIVLWTTDHGDGLPRHKREVYDSGIRVPLILRWPGSLRPAGATPGSVNPRLVSFVDLAPTLLAWAGVDPPPPMVGGVFAGPDAAPPRPYVFASRDRMDEVPDRQRAVRDLRFKYIRNDMPGPGAQHLDWRDVQDGMRALWSLHESGALAGPPARWFAPRPAEELYDLESDPHEVVDLASDPAHSGTLARMRSALDTWLAQTDDQGAVSEERLIERFRPGGAEPLTAPPRIRFGAGVGGGEARLESPTPGASLGYRLPGDSSWRLYSGPLGVGSGDRLEAKAVRYGWAESEVAVGTAP